MDDLVIPFAGVFRDNNLREDISLEKIAQLKTAFDKSERGTLTAANSTPLTDGAAAVLLASRGVGRQARAARAGLPHLLADLGQQLRRGRGSADGADHRRVAHARARRLKLQDFDFYEIHEAFAAQVLATLKAFEDPDYCRKYLGRDAAAGLDRPRQAQRQGLEPRLRTSRSRRPARASWATSPSCSPSTAAAGSSRVCTAGGMGVAAIMESRKAAEMRLAA